ncbi:MAG TPA: type III-B CRISPR-associated protein Cas10/Cmr2 [Chroococcidiopsis sp.]
MSHHLQTPSFYQRKLYALLRSPSPESISIDWLSDLHCFSTEGSSLLPALEAWWNEHKGHQSQDIAASSDRVNLAAIANRTTDTIAIRHPISGEAGVVNPLARVPDLAHIPAAIRNEPDAKKVFSWFWRFYPELWLNTQSSTLSDGLLFPAYRVLPDCPLHSHQATVSALTGALFPDDWQEGQEPTHPYLLIFTFSPIQDFIKASRKFLDFWAGSYLLHYLSARLCWHIAEAYGPDAVIVPSLWGQDVMDAFLLEHYQNSDPDFGQLLKASFEQINDAKTPVERFSDRDSTSLSTAGFPNVITALVPGKAKAKALGAELAELLRTEWAAIGAKVRQDIQRQVSQEAATIFNDLDGPQWQQLWQQLKEGRPTQESPEPYQRDLEKWRSQQDQYGNLTYPNWEWNVLWEAQLNNAWEPYWAAVPLGDPQQPVAIAKDGAGFDRDWKAAQNSLSLVWESSQQPIPNRAEEQTFPTLNVGTWWGSFQQRLRLAIQTVKNTRSWQIPVAPGERSTISGQYSAVHPNLNYQVVHRNGATLDFREGGGLPEGSMRLFWLLMGKAYPGLFNGSERLNALELTKRMGWIYGDVAESLGIRVSRVVKQIQRRQTLLDKVQQSWDVQHLERFLYDRFIRFPNLSSIAAARFIHDNPALARQYYEDLEKAIGKLFSKKQERILQRISRRRPSHIPKTDRQIKQDDTKHKWLNGVMFSAKWLAEDLALDRSETQRLRGEVDRVHQRHHFGEGSPADWWAVVLADGDGMGQYISGQKLDTYDKYLVDVDDSGFEQETADAYRQLRETTQKRMGPATHVGLNRALLDFSNRLVPYLTEKRFCGKLIYSGGDDVMAVLPLEDLPEYVRSLRAAWSGAQDPMEEFDHGDGYWRPRPGPDGTYPEGIPHRPLFTMGNTATMSMGVVIAHKSVPLPTVLESLWDAEGDRAKKMAGKDGLCFRVIYGVGNTLEALLKGHLL